MNSQTHRDQVGGTTFHVGDCYIWAEIHYMDSTTDYRECLPGRASDSVSRADDLVMLDDLECRSLSAVKTFLILLVAGIILGMTIRLMFS
jgi:hypothetical protein